MNRTAAKSLALQIVSMHFPFQPNTHELRSNVVADLIERACGQEYVDPDGLTHEEVREAWKADMVLCGQEQKELRDRIAELERVCGQDERAINLLVGVRDSAVTDDGLCVICLEDPHASGCVMTLVENYIHELDDAELAAPAAPSERGGDEIEGHYAADAGFCACGEFCETGTGFRRHIAKVRAGLSSQEGARK